MKSGGYGYFLLDGRAVGRKPKRGIMAHRMAWILTNGSIKKGMLVCHHCDVKRCVRPSHLFIGTVRDNAYDMYSKGKCLPFKLTLAQVLLIRNMALPFTQKRLSKLFGVSTTTIREIIKKQTWKDSLCQVLDPQFRPRRKKK